MNETPERICDALEWLTGHKWADNGLVHGKPSFACSDGDQTFEWDSEDGYCLHRGWLKCPSEDNLAHALAVTAPWEWKKLECLEETWRVQSPCIDTDAWFAPRENRWYAALNIDGLSVSANDEVFLTSREEAQAFARAAYLCWMRGRFAMKGGLA